MWLAQLAIAGEAGLVHLHVGVCLFHAALQPDTQPASQVDGPQGRRQSVCGCLILLSFLQTWSLLLLEDYAELFPLLTPVAYIPGDQAWHMLMNVGFI